MNISKINSSLTSQANFQSFKSNNDDFENPISRSTEKSLAIWGSLCSATVIGGIVGGATSFAVKKAATEKTGLLGFLSAYKIPVLAGAAAAVVTLLVSLPSKIYNTNVNAFVKQKEMDVFTRDRDLKSNLTEEVNLEVKDSKVSLDKKLDDNLKLQMANRGAAIGIANVTAQPQG